MGMLAAGVLGGYAMPVYSTATPDEIRHFMHETHARFVPAEDQEQVDKVLDLGDQVQRSRTSFTTSHAA